MKTILALLLMTSACFGQTIASRRYAELDPTQYSFGPFAAVAPFNNQPHYSTVTNSGQLQPPSLITANDNFSSTAEFTTAFSTGSPTFTVASNQGSVTIPSGASLAAVDSNATLAAPTQFVQLEINSLPASGIVAVGIFSATEGFFAEYNPANHFIGVCFFDGTTYNYSGGVNIGTPSTPWTMGFSMVGNTGVVWLNTGSGWTSENSKSASTYYNFQTSGNLTGWHAGWYTYGSSATATYTISSFKGGAFGGVGVRDISLVTKPDGTPFMVGSASYFTASTCGATAACFDGVYSYDVVAGSLVQIGAIFDSRGGAVENDLASHLVFDPQSGTYYYIVGGWATGQFPPSYLAEFSKSTTDPLAGGVVVVSGTQMTLPYSTENWDAHLVCTAFDYSADTCGKWLIGYSGSGTDLASSSSDPSANTWTGVVNLSTPSIYEGNRMLRTATSASGVSYFMGVGGKSGGSSDQRIAQLYTTTGSVFGTLSAPLPAGELNAPHPQIFSYGNTEYFVTFGDNLFGATGSTMGNWLVATAPKYSAQTNWPLLKNVGSSFSGSSSVSSVSVSTGSYASTFTVAAGDLIVGACRGANNTETSATVTDSLGNTLTSMAMNINGSGFTNGFYGFATIAGTDTITCSLGAASTFVGLTAEQFAPGFLTSVDFTGYSNQTSSNLSLYTSSSFSTTDKGLIIACPDALFGAGTFQPGFVGPYGAAFGAGLISGAAPCEGTITPAAQTNITATMATGNSTTGHWGGVIMSFK